MKTTIFSTPYLLVQQSFDEYQDQIAILSKQLLDAASNYYPDREIEYLECFLPLKNLLKDEPRYQTLTNALERYEKASSLPSGGTSDFDNDASILISVIPFALEQFNIHGPSAIHHQKTVDELMDLIAKTHNTPRAKVSAFFYFGVLNAILTARRANGNNPIDKERLLNALDQGIKDVAFQLRAYQYQNVMHYFARLSRSIHAKNNIIKPSESLGKIKKAELAKSNYVIDALEVALCGLINSEDEASLMEYIASLEGEEKGLSAPALALAALAYRPNLKANKKVMAMARFDNRINVFANRYVNMLFNEIMVAFSFAQNEKVDLSTAYLYADLKPQGYPLKNYEKFNKFIFKSLTPLVKSQINKNLS